MKVVYKAYDGKEFETKQEALDYESKNCPERWISFEGHSDDNVIFNDVKMGISDEYSIYTKFHLSNEYSGCFVIPRYNDNGTWSFEIQMEDEGVNLPFNKVEYASMGYSITLHIKVAKGVKIDIT